MVAPGVGKVAQGSGAARDSHRDCTRHALNATIGSNVYTTIQQVTESFPGSAGVAGLMIPWARILQALYPVEDTLFFSFFKIFD
eukprot:COSAG02_NODE_623_length_19389_cov_30.043753_4_plen_84_part_00